MEGIVKENILFQRGLDSKDALGVGLNYLYKKRLKELFSNQESFIMRNVFSDWEDDSWVGADIQDINNNIVDVLVYYDDEDGDETSTRIDFNINNIEFIDEEQGSAYIKLKKPVTTSY